MSFKKYSSIENSYQQKYLFKILVQHPELQNIQYIVREKIDGSNIQLYFTPNQEMQVGKRSQFIGKDENFFDVWTVLERYRTEVQKLQEYADKHDVTIRLYGEIYGDGVQKRVHYGKVKSILFFDIEIAGNLLAQRSFENQMKLMSLDWLLAPKIGLYENLNDALAVDVNFNTKLSSEANNASEGIVIQPYNEVMYLFKSDERFILKKKNEKFLEKENKDHKAKEPVDGSLLSILTSFRGYINENRVLNVFSKHGEIKDISEMGKYIKLIMEDAKEDFLKENEIPILDDKAAKIVFNVGGEIARILRSKL